jgi:hypothetical protein
LDSGELLVSPGKSPKEGHTSRPQGATAPNYHSIAEAVVIAVLVGVAALFCIRMAFVHDADIWWHLRTGEWMVQHGGIPHTDHFTSFGTGKPWAAYSWLFELLVYKLFQRFGLTGIVMYSTGMVVAIAVAIFHLIRRLQPDFSIAVLITLAISFTLTRLFTPRPWLFSILFFALELDILMHVRKTGRMRELLWLPVIFALWANIHIQFVDGLLVLGLAVGEAILARWWTRGGPRLHIGWMVGTLLACLLATLANPYGWNIYKVAHDLATQPGVLNQIAELDALSFRATADYCVLYLALASAGMLAWKRLPLFETGLLLFAATISFRSGRDMWVLAITAGVILAAGWKSAYEDRRPFTLFVLPAFGCVTMPMLYLGFLFMDVNNAALQAQLAKTMPVQAVERIKDNHYAGPLYNTYDWGGYLIWELRLPVSVDGRAAFDGEDRLGRSFATWNAAPNWASDPDLISAGLVIGPVEAPLTQLLRMDARFKLVFEDKVSAVFVRRT